MSALLACSRKSPAEGALSSISAIFAQRRKDLAALELVALIRYRLQEVAMVMA